MFPSINKLSNKNSNSAKIFPKYEYKLNFDGCSKGNPGLAGAGAVIYKNDDEYWSGHFFVGENYTNNQAEYSGLIMGLQQAKEFGIESLHVEGDSLLVINQMKGLYDCKAKKLIDLYNRAKELETYFHTIEYNHVYRDKNKRADELSNIAINEHLPKMNK